MEEERASDINRFASSIGVLIDRVLSKEEILGTVWLIGENKVATNAHLLIAYAEYLSALKVRFPVTGQEFGIAKASFHPRFNRKLTAQLAQQPPSGTTSILPLQKHNAVVLTLTAHPQDLTPEIVSRLNQKLSLPLPSRDQGLGGNLSEIDLALVIQTINNARREGVLVISDERNRPLARLFCQGGRLMYALYNNLVNESAIYQMINHKISGNFFFSAQHEPDWEALRAITRPTDMLLIESHRRMDELPKVSALFGGEETLPMQAAPDLNLDIVPPELKEQSIILWKYLDGTTYAKDLWQLANMDDYAIFQTLNELWKTHQIIDTSKSTSEKSHKEAKVGGPLPVNAQSPLAPWDKIETVIVNQATGSARVKSGSLLGALRPLDPWHLLHNLSLLPRAAGLPLFKDGQVIGMHCGSLPADPASTDGNIQQMLWSESILECLSDGSEPELVRRLTLAGEDFVRKITESNSRRTEDIQTPPEAGCREVARIDCPRCGSSHLDSARFCKSCGHRLIQDVDMRSSNKPKNEIMLAVAFVLMVIIAIPAIAWFKIPHPIFITGPLIYLPTTPWVDVALFKARVKNPDRVKIKTDKTTRQLGQSLWQRVPNNIRIKKGDLIHIKMTVNDPCFIYVVNKNTSDNSASLIYPDLSVKNWKDKDTLINHGVTFTIPEKTEEIDKKAGQLTLTGGTPQGPSGTDVILVIASHTHTILCNQPGKAEQIVKKVLPILKPGEFPEGIEIDQNVLGADLFDSSTPVGNHKRKPVYLQTLNIAHN